MKWESESKLALKATSQAGGLLSNCVSQTSSEKNNYKDIVTEFDVAAGRIIHTVLSSSSQFPIVNEEQLESHSLNTTKTPTYWVVDPIDGTTNFASGMSFYATSVGLVDNGKFVAGSVYAPKTRELYFTYGDQGSYLNGKLLSANRSVALKQASIAASFSNSLSDETLRRRQYEAFGEINDKSRTLLRLGSAALNIAYASDGRIHGAYGLNAKIWDVGAALSLAAQAGCSVYYEFIDPLNLNYIVGSEYIVSDIRTILSGKGLLYEKH